MDRNEHNCAICSDSDGDRGGAERGSFIVAVITLSTMVAEIVFGFLTGSMALLADGIHMGTHAIALFITAIAYFLSRKLRHHQGFSFGTGKISVLSGYTNALLLAVTAVFMVVEAVGRLVHPATISFDTAILVAVLGLAINLVSALILNGFGHSPGHSHSHHDHTHEQQLHDHQHAHDTHDHAHADSNLKAALAHVLADAMTSVLAIAALLAGKFWGWNFLDSSVALLGAALILRWAWFLLKDTSAVLLDFGDWDEEIGDIRDRIAALGAELRDVHIWRYSENERALMLTVYDPSGRTSNGLRRELEHHGHFEHVTIEMAPPQPGRPG